ncbi:hypothetical protein FLONG3_420 [Fusarium longipes]|uniref:Heterokaryon incompatibility domain-containing protein n=1 Tax=Fusarium longipes TaxID=694270 RepID=A0A395T9Y1_9HYPO|nr:hypothetical protein FLONG3_420 [Fusarium longipes]
MNNIDWHDLPATFRDAVAVCRSMDIRYLWIDSLCILQNFAGMTPDEVEITSQDFVLENSNMAGTYQNSHFTISADLSTHMDSGMFSTEPVDDYSVEVTTDDGQRTSLFVRQCEINHYTERPELERRGWTLQEFLLPPRVLHFGMYDIEWRCGTHFACECGEIGLQEAEACFSWHRHNDFQESTRTPPDDPQGILVWWEQVVNNYCNRGLTNATDKLPALSGLAQRRNQIRSGVYLAGLWQESLLHDLCWYSAIYHQVSYYHEIRRPIHYRAPSWSWASLDGPGSCFWWWIGPDRRHPCKPKGEPEPACIFIDAACELATNDQTGAVKGGYLDMAVALIPGGISPYTGDLFDISNRWLHGLETPHELEIVTLDCPGEEGAAIGDRVFCAPIAQFRSPDELQYGCLVLQQLDAGTYRRVGFCSLTGRVGSTPSECNRGWYEQNQSVLSTLDDYVIPDSSRVRIRII